MPQLDFSTYFSQIIWFLAFFLGLYYMVSNIVLPNMTSIIDKRAKIISDELQLAAVLRQKIEIIDLECKNIIITAKKKASKMVEDNETMTRDREITQIKQLDIQLKNNFLTVKSRLERLENDIRQMEELKLQSTRLFVNNILEEEVDDQTLINIIRDVENSNRLQKN